MLCCDAYENMYVAIGLSALGKATSQLLGKRHHSNLRWQKGQQETDSTHADGP